MSTDPRHKLHFGPYKPPRLHVGDRATCLARDCDVIVTSWTASRIPWPRCCAEGTHGGGSGILLDEEIARAVRNESEAANRYWWGASVNSVKWWRRMLSVTLTNNPSTRRLITAAAKLGAAAAREPGLMPEETAERRERARRLNLIQHARCYGAENLGWSPMDIALLGTMPDDEVARLTGKSHNAVRIRREWLGIPNPTDRRRNRKPRRKTT